MQGGGTKPFILHSVFPPPKNSDPPNPETVSEIGEKRSEKPESGPGFPQNVAPNGVLF